VLARELDDVRQAIGHGARILTRYESVTLFEHGADGGGSAKKARALGFFDRPINGRHVVGHSGSNPDTGHDADLEMVWDGEWTVIVLSNYDAPAGVMLEMPILDLIAGSSKPGQVEVTR
jgi:hypothetical protein